MKKIVKVIVIMFLFIRIPAICAEIDGQWNGIVNGADGQKLEASYFFLAEGKTLKGSIQSQLWFIPIFEGKIDGKNIEFKVNTKETTLAYNGTLSGDEIRMTQIVGKEKTTFVLKRYGDQIDLFEIEDGVRTRIRMKAKR